MNGSDFLLDGKVRLRQEDSPFRASLDAVFLAAAAPLGSRVLDVGAGSGAVALCYWNLCYAAWHGEASIDALELQKPAYELLLENIALNRAESHVRGILADIFAFDGERESYDVVMTNPPYLSADNPMAQTPERALSMVESGWELSDWVTGCMKFLQRKGWLVMIHRSDRLHDILGSLQGRVDRLSIYPLFPKPGLASSRLLVCCRKKSSRGRGLATPQLLAGMVVHNSDGSYTEAAEKILRGEEKISIIDANQV